VLISEVIEELKEIQKRYGDTEVIVQDILGLDYLYEISYNSICKKAEIFIEL
jgi:hypothetical protein